MTLRPTTNGGHWADFAQAGIVGPMRRQGTASWQSRRVPSGVCFDRRFLRFLRRKAGGKSTSRKRCQFAGRRLPWSGQWRGMNSTSPDADVTSP